MKISEIKTQDWASQLNKISKTLENRDVNIEVFGMDVGAQLQVDSVHLKGLTYDTRDDVVEISLDNYQHIIPQPTAIYMTSENDSIESIQSIEFVDGRDRKQLLTFVEPLLLA